MKTTFRISVNRTPDGGQTKLPPTRMLSSEPRISSVGFQSHALAGFEGAWRTASSTYGDRPSGLSGGSPASSLAMASTEAASASEGRTCASAGVEVILKPPALEMEGM